VLWLLIPVKQARKQAMEQTTPKRLTSARCCPLRLHRGLLATPPSAVPQQKPVGIGHTHPYGWSAWSWLAMRRVAVNHPRPTPGTAQAPPHPRDRPNPAPLAGYWRSETAQVFPLPEVSGNFKNASPPASRFGNLLIRGYPTPPACIVTTRVGVEWPWQFQRKKIWFGFSFFGFFFFW
jgi:hypothetical protein